MAPLRAQRPRALAPLVTARRGRTPSPLRARSTRGKPISVEGPPSFAMPLFHSCHGPARPWASPFQPATVWPCDDPVPAENAIRPRKVAVPSPPPPNRASCAGLIACTRDPEVATSCTLGAGKGVGCNRRHRRRPHRRGRHASPGPWRSVLHGRGCGPCGPRHVRQRRHPLDCHQRQARARLWDAGLGGRPTSSPPRERAPPMPRGWGARLSSSWRCRGLTSTGSSCGGTWWTVVRRCARWRRPPCAASAHRWRPRAGTTKPRADGRRLEAWFLALGITCWPGPTAVWRQAPGAPRDPAASPRSPPQVRLGY